MRCALHPNPWLIDPLPINSFLCSMRWCAHSSYLCRHLDMSDLSTHKSETSGIPAGRSQLHGRHGILRKLAIINRNVVTNESVMLSERIMASNT